MLVLGWLLSAWLVAPGMAQGAGEAHAAVTFTYENPKLQPAKYVMEVDDAGRGTYRSQVSDAAPPDAVGVAAQGQDRKIEVTPAFRDQIFLMARQLKFFRIACDDSKDKIAFQGKKQLSYRGPEGSSSCTYNWSKDQRIQKLTDHFEAMAFTLEEGRKLEVEHQHDRLGLDAELETLAEAFRDGRAAEVGNIAPQLKAILEDEAVMDRARERARLLLVGGKPR